MEKLNAFFPPILTRILPTEAREMFSSACIETNWQDQGQSGEEPKAELQSECQNIQNIPFWPVKTSE